MPNVCDFYIHAFGEESDLQAIIEFASPAVSIGPGGDRDDFVLDQTSLFDSWEESNKRFIGLCQWNVEQKEQWCRLLLNTNPEPTNAKKTYIQNVITNLGLDAQHDETVRFAIERACPKEPDLPMPPCISMSGISMDSPPFSLVERLSKMWPMVCFEYGGITNNSFRESWTCVDGNPQCLQMCRINYAWEIQTANFTWIFKDGVRLDPPVYEFGEPTFWPDEDDNCEPLV